MAAPPPAGAVVLVRFPFSDLSSSKLRPAVVLADAERDDFILCQITSNPYADPHAVELTQGSFRTGGLQRTSYARPGKLFTSNTALIVKQVGRLGPEAHRDVAEAVIRLLESGLEQG